MTQTVIGVLLLAGAGALMAWLVRYGKRVIREEHAARAQRAAALGWQYDDTQRGSIEFTLRGTTAGIPWELTYDSDTGSDSPTPGVRWLAPSLAARGTMFLITGRAHYDLLRGIGGKIIYGIGKALSRSIGGPGVIGEQEFLKNARELPVGSSAFRQAFVTVAQEAALGSALIDNQAERLLMEWPDYRNRAFDGSRHISIWGDTRGLRVDISSGLADMPRIEHVVKLGALLAGRYRDRLARYR